MATKMTGWVLAAMAVLCSVSLAADVKMEVSAKRTSIYLGESVILTVKVSGMDAPPQPDVSAITNAAVKFLGNQSVNYAKVTWINGRRSEESFLDRIFTYEIKPNGIGLLAAGPIRLNMDGSVLTQAGPLIEVIGVEKQEWAILNVSASRDTVLVDEPFDITLSLALKELRPPYADNDPLDPNDPPSLSVPFLNPAPIDGLQMPDVQALLQSRVVSGRNVPGFTLNSYTLQRNIFDFDSFATERKAKFLFEKRHAERNGAGYSEYTIKLTYTPTQEGSYTFGPAEFKGRIITAVDAEGRAAGKSLFAVGPASTVRVVPPPEDGRPACYIGALGTNLQVDATLDAQTCHVGDPLKLTLSISGGVRLENIYPPRLRLQPELGRNFRINEDSIDTTTKDNRKQYFYTIRPTRAGTYELPPIEVAFYDTKSRSYRIVKTPPLPVHASETSPLEVSSIIITSNRLDRETPAMEGDNLIAGPLNVDPAGAVPCPLGPRPWHLVLIVLGPAAYGAVRLGRHIRSNIPRIAEAEKRRHAPRHAARLLHEARQQAAGNALGARRLICDAMRGYLGDRFGVPGAGLTPVDARMLLVEKTGNRPLADEFGNILERSFNAAFSQAAGDALAARDSEDAVGIIEKIEQTCRTDSRERHS